MTDFEKVKMVLDEIEKLTKDFCKQAINTPQEGMKVLTLLWKRSFSTFFKTQKEIRVETSVGRGRRNSENKTEEILAENEIASKLIMLFGYVDKYSKVIVPEKLWGGVENEQHNKEQANELSTRTKNIFDSYDKVAEHYKILRYRPNDKPDGEIKKEEEQQRYLNSVDVKPRRKRLTLAKRGELLKKDITLYVTHYHTLKYLDHDTRQGHAHSRELFNDIKVFSQAYKKEVGDKKCSFHKSLASIKVDYEALGGGAPRGFHISPAKGELDFYPPPEKSAGPRKKHFNPNSKSAMRVVEELETYHNGDRVIHVKKIAKNRPLMMRIRANARDNGFPNVDGYLKALKFTYAPRRTGEFFNIRGQNRTPEEKQSFFEQKGKLLKSAITLHVTHYHTLKGFAEIDPDLDKGIDGFVKLEMSRSGEKKYNIQRSLSTIGVDYKYLCDRKPFGNPIDTKAETDISPL
ncbi:MAG: hypothetical protein FWC00_04070 [Firmicutes bacterium]|nr:hypothetical protein [Bacillota bacterium]